MKIFTLSIYIEIKKIIRYRLITIVLFLLTTALEASNCNDSYNQKFQDILEFNIEYNAISTRARIQNSCCNLESEQPIDVHKASDTSNGVRLPLECILMPKGLDTVKSFSKNTKSEYVSVLKNVFIDNSLNDKKKIEFAVKRQNNR